jgi:hypothetical protein
MVPLFKGDAPRRKRSHPIEIIGVLSERIVHEMQECGRARHETIADTKTVGRLEQSTLKTTVSTKRGMKVRAPKRIMKVAIDRGWHSGSKRSTHVIALHEASRLDEIREAHAHPVLERRHPGHGGQLQRHEIAKVNSNKASQESCQGFRVA